MELHDRTDATITRGVLLAVAIVTPLVLLVLPLVDWLRDEPLTWAGDPGTSARVPGTAAGASATWDGEATVSLAHASTGLWLAVLGTALLLAAAVASVALLLRHVVGQIRSSAPFTPSSLRALRAAGLVITGTAVLHPLVAGLTTSAVMDRVVEDSPFSVGFGFSPLWLLAGVLVLAVAEAFRAGLRLTHDVEGLV